MQIDSATENDAVVSLTESAAQQVKVLLADEKENAGKTLRLSSRRRSMHWPILT